MKIANPKEQEQHGMRQHIAKVALELMIATGYEKVSMRTIAAKIGYSPATIYLHFKDKDDLLFALHQHGFAKLRASCQSVVSTEAPFDRLVSIGRMYIQFAVDNPELYALMFIRMAPIRSLKINNHHSEPDWRISQPAFDALTSAVRECVGAHAESKQNAERTALIIWGTLHGLVLLFLRKRVPFIEREGQKTIMNETIDLFMNMIKKSPCL